MSKHLVPSRTAGLAPRLGVLLLTLACLALEATLAPTAAAASPAAVTAPRPAALTATAVLPATFLESASGDQARMIQVGVIIVIIGIFLLSKSIR